MMHFRLKLRESKTLVTPKGPHFKFARTVKITISGTEVIFKAPKHRPMHSNRREMVPEREYEYDRLRFRSNYGEEEARGDAIKNWEEALLLSRSWAFNGPWFTGTLAELSLSVRVIHPKNYAKELSLFHPRALEMVIGDYLTFLYGHRKNEFRNNIQEYLGPLDWQPLHHLSVNAVKLRLMSQDFTPYRRNNRFVFFPLTDDMAAMFSFDPGRLENLPEAEMDKRVSEQPMLDLMDNIINSIQLKLSPEAEAQQAAALEGLDDTSLIKDFPPIKWDKLTEEETQAVLLAHQASQQQ